MRQARGSYSLVSGAIAFNISGDILILIRILRRAVRGPVQSSSLARRSGMPASSKLFQSGRKFVPVIKAAWILDGLTHVGYRRLLLLTSWNPPRSEEWLKDESSIARSWPSCRSCGRGARGDGGRQGGSFRFRLCRARQAVDPAFVTVDYFMN